MHWKAAVFGALLFDISAIIGYKNLLLSLWFNAGRPQSKAVLELF